VELVSREQAEYIFERTVDDAIFTDLNNCLVRFGIVEKEDIRQFLAQCGHESGGLRWLKELASGDDYEWREDLGNNQAGDGRKFKGSGLIQLTGRENFTKFSEFMGDPEIVNQGCDYVAANLAASSAAFWWKNNNMSAYIADGATVEQVSTRVNGANPANGLDDRIYYYERAKEVI
jgi:predicted chitinase